MNEYILNIAREKYSELVFNSNGDVSVFSSIKEEYEALRYGVALRDVSSNVFLKLMGNNVLKFIDRLSATKVDELASNKNIVALFTNESGNIIERTLLLNMENMVFLSGCADPSKKISKWINRYISVEDILFEEVGDSYFQLEILGAQKDAFMSLICDDCYSKINGDSIVHVNINNYNFFITIVKKFGIEKYYLFGNSEYLEPIAEYLFEEEKLFDLKLVGNSAYDVFRVEQGLPAAPGELNDYHNPLEVGLKDEVSYDKNNFIGHEVFNSENSGNIIKQKLIPFVIDSGFENNGSLNIVDDKNSTQGNVSTIVKSQLLNKYLALAFVNKEVLDSDKRLFINNGADNFQIDKIKLPLR